MKNSSKILIALGAGVALGAALGILFAPDKGSETRKKIAEAPDKMRKKFADALRNGKSRLDDKFEKMEASLDEHA